MGLVDKSWGSTGSIRIYISLLNIGVVNFSFYPFHNMGGRGRLIILFKDRTENFLSNNLEFKTMKFYQKFNIKLH